VSGTYEDQDDEVLAHQVVPRRPEQNAASPGRRSKRDSGTAIDPLRLPGEVERRLALLQAPHMAPLAAFAARLRAAVGLPVPDFDPCDGGVGARLLILLETPGPRMSGAMLVSCDHAAGTARNLRRFLAGAGLPRRAVVLWNVVPWVIDPEKCRAPRTGEIAQGLTWLPALLDLLPDLRGCVLAGRAARHAAPMLARTLLPVWAMPHPSPTFVNTSPVVAERIRAVLTAARDAL